jgi:hypothetical protein
MHDPHERARRLVALATNTGASSEEARTAAMAACRLIVKHKLLDAVASPPPGDGAARRRHTRERPAPEVGSPRRRARRDGKSEGESYRAARPGTCAFCAKAFGAEDDVMTYVDAVDHWHCAKRRAAGGEPAQRG